MSTAKLPGRPGAGRPKGIKNYKTLRQEEMADTLGINPLEILLHFAAGNWKELGYTHRTRTICVPGGGSYEVDHIEVGDRISAAIQASRYFFTQKKIGVDVSLEAGSSLQDLFAQAASKTLEHVQKEVIVIDHDGRREDHCDKDLEKAT